MQVQSLSQEDRLEEGMATTSRGFEPGSWETWEHGQAWLTSLEGKA